MKNVAFIVGLLSVNLAFGQGKVGVNTPSPTNILDVNGDARVRQLLDGSSATTYPRVVVADTNGVLAYNSTIVPLLTASTDVTDNSPSMMVHKFYSSSDWVSGRTALTDMSVAKWDAILTVTKMTKVSGTGALLNTAGEPMELKVAPGTTFWRVFGDIGGVVESFEYEILFIKKNLVARDPGARIAL
jgi:hypothetical protein